MLPSICVCVPGVSVLKDQEKTEIHAPVVISDAGIFNTFQKFLPQQIQDKPGDACGFKIFTSCLVFVKTFPIFINGFVGVCVEIRSLLGMLNHGMGSFLVFVGLDGTREELNLVSTNFWMYKDNDLDSLWVLSAVQTFCSACSVSDNIWIIVCTHFNYFHEQKGPLKSGSLYEDFPRLSHALSFVCVHVIVWTEWNNTFLSAKKRS